MCELYVVVLYLQAFDIADEQRIVITTTNREEINDDASWGKSQTIRRIIINSWRWPRLREEARLIHLL